MDDVIEQTAGTLYEADEHAWIERQIAALRDGALDRLDRANLIAYLTDMAAPDRRELGVTTDRPLRPYPEIPDTTRKGDRELAADHPRAAAGDPAAAEGFAQPQASS